MIIPVFLGIGTIILGRVNRRNKNRSSILLTLASRNMTPCPQIVNSYLHEFKILTVHLMDISWIYTLYENITWLILPFAKIENLKTTKTSILIYSKIPSNPSLENTLNLVKIGLLRSKKIPRDKNKKGLKLFPRISHYLLFSTRFLSKNKLYPPALTFWCQFKFSVKTQEEEKT